jgi:DeoR/GlpR family transcriptional regulator of sugar metabolism
MLAAERHQKILTAVQSRGFVRTVDIAQELAVTEETVRRDFEKLEAEAQLQRTHGGAVRVEASHRDLPLSSRATENVAAKQAIAALAIPLIEPGDTVLFDASSTVFELARRLPDLPVTILTPALTMAVELSQRPSVRVVLLGGVVSPRSLSCQGPLAEQALECYHVQKAFLSCRGIEAARGLSETTDETARLKRRMMALADHTYLMADHSKMGVKSAFFFAKPGDIGTLLTDRQPPKNLREAFRTAGTRLVLPTDA